MDLKQAAEAVDHILQDCLKPTQQQRYKLGRHVINALRSIERLGIEKLIDLDLLKEYDKTEKYPDEEEKWNEIKEQIERARGQKI